MPSATLRRKPSKGRHNQHHHGRRAIERDLKQLRPDQTCVYRSDNTASSRRTMLYISVYKPPHKLSSQYLRAGLRIADIHEEVTYYYMIESGLEYGLLITGEAIVFLKVDWNDPETLYYHLAEPGPEVTAHPNNLQMCTAVGQYLAFTLIANGGRFGRRSA
ncbi:Uncharacterized protein HZ326_26945 [Fusarium oxysporum f. sp. albedinis]|nr:Uncharacterized protein HZ326_26945 [Fusarium oxysporum f. sp. albedinis]